MDYGLDPCPRLLILTSTTTSKSHLAHEEILGFSGGHGYRELCLYGCIIRYGGLGFSLKDGCIPSFLTLIDRHSAVTLLLMSKSYQCHYPISIGGSWTLTYYGTMHELMDCILNLYNCLFKGILVINRDSSFPAMCYVHCLQ